MGVPAATMAAVTGAEPGARSSGGRGGQGLAPLHCPRADLEAPSPEPTSVPCASTTGAPCLSGTRGSWEKLHKHRTAEGGCLQPQAPTRHHIPVPALPQEGRAPIRGVKAVTGRAPAWGNQRG